MSFKVKAIYEYNSGHDDDLKFNVGQIITVTEQEDDDWYAGEFVDGSGVKQEGIFPRNFVEKYEPTAPPRPTRTRTKNHPEQQSATSDSPPAPAPAPRASPKLPAHEPEPEEEIAAPATKTAPAPPPEPAAAPEPTLRKSTEIKSPPAAPKPAPAPAPAPQPAVTSPPPAKPTSSQSKPAPPPVTEKPSSFKDRIAAFNKSAAPPIAPFKPSGLGAGGGAGFIKKPFVAPPPSRNAYVPPAQSAPVAKVYRRDEDPEIKEREAETQESAEKAGLVPGAAPAAGAEAGGEDEPKPMSLKERLALLQKQQLENAQRHADAVAKKEKPKRPAKKRMESHDGHGHAEEAEASAPAPPPPDRRDSEDVARKSIDEPHPPRVPHPTRRRSSKGPEPHDGNEADMSGAGETTEGQEDDHTEREDSDHQPKHIATAAKQDDERLDEEEVVDEEDEDEEEEEDDVDPEIRRKEELRARMARIAGGMGGMGGMGAIFGGGMPSGAAPAAPPKRKKSVAPEASEEAASPSTHAPPIPTMMALPGMSRVKSAEKAPPREEDESEEEEDEAELRTPHQESAPQFAPREAGGPPPVPSGRPAPPPVPTESRPPPPPAAVESESQGSQSDDELSERGAPGESAPAPSQATRAPPPLPPLSAPSPMLPTSPTTASSNRRSFIGDGAHPTSTTAGAPPPPPENRRNSRAPPPLPGAAPALSPNQSRPPPPPPPGALSRSSTADTLGPLSPTRQVPHAERLNEEEEVTEYEGDYDTDIASSAPHKDALKSHQRESSFEDNTSVRSPATEAPPSMPPPLPNTSAPRGPPPIPSQPPPETSRRSVDAPRAAPPPPPKEAPRYGDDDYDPFNYASPPPVPSVSHPPPPPPPSRPAEDPYVATSPYQSPPPDRRGPPPAPPSAAPAPPSRANTRQSLDVQRPAAGSSRRSVDVARPSMESGFVANELDLAGSSGWWLKPDSLPPQLQGRKDIYFESDESTSSNPRGKTIITRDIYVLYQDYSQTVITVRFDPHDATDVDLSQRHEAPPRTLRQDQLEQSYERFGRAIGDSVPSKQNTVIGDGTPQALIYDLLRPHRDALLPVGTRAYGALVYSNLANASTTQNDEIRPGDIISIRNAKFQGKHGPMHAKYSVEVGKPDHVGIVAEWDGTKKKVRAWEQGRESKKVKMESFKLDDLRSGEVKIWRVMPRSWVGWEGVGN